jgi:hypothetical protein
VHGECARDAIDSGKKFLQQRFTGRQVTIHPLVTRKPESKS